jgi:hypothetical protein
MLTRINNKAKVCRLTKALKLRDAKIISFKDIIVAQVARAIKDIKVKGKCSRKRNSNTLKADELEANKQELKLELKANLELKVARVIEEVINSKGKCSRKRKITANKLKLKVALYTLVL